MPYIYDQESGWYFDSDTGDRLSLDFVEEKAAESIIASKDTTDIIADLFGQGTVSFTDTYDASWLAIKDEYIRQYLLAYGGRENMTFVEWGSIGGMLSDQKRYFNEMMALLESGDISPAEFKRRMRMYINSASEAYWKARGKEMNRLGFDMVSWNLGATENHCGDCPSWAGMGEQPVCNDGGFPSPKGCTFPGGGVSECLTNCGCYLVYSKSETGEVFS